MGVVVVAEQEAVEEVEISTLDPTAQNNGENYPLKTRNEYGKADKSRLNNALLDNRKAQHRAPGTTQWLACL